MTTEIDERYTDKAKEIAEKWYKLPFEDSSNGEDKRWLIAFISEALSEQFAAGAQAERERILEVLAEAILTMSKGVKAMNASRLSRAAIVALIKDKSGLSKSTIEIVLNNLDQLELNWLKKKPAK